MLQLWRENEIAKRKRKIRILKIRVNKTNKQRKQKILKQSQIIKKQVKSEHAWMARVQDSNEKVKWILDSGASQHMTNTKNWFESYTILQKPINIETANSMTTAIGRKNIRMKTFVNGEC